MEEKQNNTIKPASKINNLFEYKYFIFLLRIILGGIFVYASIGKIIEPAVFAKAVKNYDMLPISFIHIPAIILPYLEFFSGAFLILGRFKIGSSILIMLMLFFFLIGLIQAYVRGMNINCGCFSLETEGSGSDILYRIVEDLLMFSSAVLIFVYNFKIKYITNIRLN